MTPTLALAAPDSRELPVDRTSRLQHDDGAAPSEAAGARAIIQLAIELRMIAGQPAPVRRSVLTGHDRATVLPLGASFGRCVGPQRQAEHADGRRKAAR